METKQQEERKVPVVGILTGISYVSGIDYYQNINEIFTSLVPRSPPLPMAPNPPILLSSIDCAPYAHALCEKDWERTKELLVIGVDRIAKNCDFLCFASNTAHISYENVVQKYPSIPVLHIADVTAFEIKKKKITKVGLLGTEPTMTENYLKDRLALHKIETIVPESEEDLQQVFWYIMNELGFNKFNDECRNFFVKQIQLMVEKGAQGIILGCTEIELLELEGCLPSSCSVPLFRSAKLHIEAIARVQAGKSSLPDYFPE